MHLVGLLTTFLINPADHYIGAVPATELGSFNLHHSILTSNIQIASKAATELMAAEPSLKQVSLSVLNRTRNLQFIYAPNPLVPRKHANRRA
jgi:hypothetical protein